MQGLDLVQWRRRNGYSQEELIMELGVKSRQTISTWENSEREIPRMVELAVRALELDANCRRLGGKKASARDKRDYFIGDNR